MKVIRYHIIDRAVAAHTNPRMALWDQRWSTVMKSRIKRMDKKKNVSFFISFYDYEEPMIPEGFNTVE